MHEQESVNQKPVRFVRLDNRDGLEAILGRVGTLKGVRPYETLKVACEVCRSIQPRNDDLLSYAQKLLARKNGRGEHEE